MNGECSNCSEHTVACRCIKMKFCKKCKNEKVACVCMSLDISKRRPIKKITVTMDLKDATDLIHWARRYCDGRCTHVPSSFNQILKRVRSDNESLILTDTLDQALTEGGIFWPFAQDGMYDPQTRAFDATR